MADVEAACDLLPSERDGLCSALARLVATVRTHNAHEEELLGAVMPTIDAWGPVRTEVMTEEHTKEHNEMYATLLDAGYKADGEEVRALIEHMREHMAIEERMLLADDVLCDDIVFPREYFAG